MYSILIGLGVWRCCCCCCCHNWTILAERREIILDAPDVPATSGPLSQFPKSNSPEAAGWTPGWDALDWTRHAVFGAETMAKKRQQTRARIEADWLIAVASLIEPTSLLTVASNSNSNSNNNNRQRQTTTVETKRKRKKKSQLMNIIQSNGCHQVTIR